jgi:hypothetical protein
MRSASRQASSLRDSWEFVMGTSPRSSELEKQLRRVREEYLNAPNLRLMPAGAQRVFGLQPVRCMEILEALLGENFLRRTSDGLFCARRFCSAQRRVRSAKRARCRPTMSAMTPADAW